MKWAVNALFQARMTVHVKLSPLKCPRWHFYTIARLFYSRPRPLSLSHAHFGTVLSHFVLIVKSATRAGRQSTRLFSAMATDLGSYCTVRPITLLDKKSSILSLNKEHAVGYYLYKRFLNNYLCIYRLTWDPWEEAWLHVTRRSRLGKEITAIIPLLANKTAGSV